MYYHCTDIGGLKVLKPTQSNQGKLVYLSDNRQRGFPYLVNPIQVFVDKKYGKGKIKTGYRIASSYISDGIVTLNEIYPGFIEDSFKGQTGYIYYFEDVQNIKPIGRECMYGSEKPLKVEKVEVIPDVYEEILKLEGEGKIKINKYNNLSPEHKKRLTNFYIGDYLKATNPYYKEYLVEKMSEVAEYLKENSLL